MRAYAAFRSVVHCAYSVLRRRNFFVPADARSAVVFAGDSITEQWATLESDVAHLKAVNRGISGDSSAGLLSRFEADIIACQPRAVVILIGTNDLAAGVHPRRVAAAIRLMIGMAIRCGASVILCLVPPRTKAPGAFTEEIHELNSLIRGLARGRKNVQFCDTFSPFADRAGACRKEFFTDGLHLNAAGYGRLAAALQLGLGHLLK
jgi:acyl-CoA thioesterase-1